MDALAAKVMPVRGGDGKLLGVSVNGIVHVRSNADDNWDMLATSVLNHISALAVCDDESATAKLLLEKDASRLASLHTEI